ncbi:MAG: fused MFS/spermidine synthase, partial [bacterium]
EILGTRILGPFYGVSLFLWSALITVTLAALSLGYAVGGRWADRGPTRVKLSVLLLLAGLLIVLIPWLRRPVLLIAEPMSLRFAVLLAAAILFFPPLTLLGMVSPYAVRLKASRIEVVGTTAGNLYAVSTIAGVAAALLTGFFLIPNVGVFRLTIAIGVLLVGTSLAGIAGRAKAPARLLILAVTAGAVYAAAVHIPQPAYNENTGVLSVRQSPYAEVRVVDVNNLRYLLINGSAQSILDLDTGRSRCEYVNVLDIAKKYFDHPGRLLLVGLGGGSVVNHFAWDGWRIDAVEIDPVVTRAAHDHFELDDDQATVFHADGREFFASCDAGYDLIILDAFSGTSIPFQLVTVESFELAASRLNEGGLVAVNLECSGWHDKIVRAFAATLEQVFPEVLALPLAEPPNTQNNLILLASRRQLDLPKEKEPPVPIGRLSAAYDRFHAWENRFRPDTRKARVLTDDLNPVDVWSETLNAASRRELHAYFGNKGLDW